MRSKKFRVGRETRSVVVARFGFRRREHGSSHGKSSSRAIWLRCAMLATLLASSMSLLLSGCGVATPVSASSTGNELVISANEVSFGSVLVGETATASITATNTGSSAIQINQIDVSGQGFSVAGSSGLPVTLAKGGSYTASVQFNPPSTGTLTGTLSVNASSETATVALSGTGEAAAFSELSSLSCNEQSMSGAGTDACTVKLTAAADSSGLSVGLSSDNAAVSVPSSVKVAAGSTTGTFTAKVSSVSSSQTATLTATGGGLLKTYTIRLTAAESTPSGVLSSLSCGEQSMSGSGTDACTVKLTAAAGSGGLSVGLSSNNAAVSVPSSVTVAAGATTSSFSAKVSSVSSSQTATVTATAGSVTKSYAISLSATATAGVLSSLSCSEQSMSGSGTDACTVKLTAAAGSGGLSVGLSSNNAAVSVPSSVTIAAGSTTSSFSAKVSSVSSSQTATVTATAGSVTKSYAISLSEGTPSLTLQSTSVAFGDTSLNTPATQSVVLTSSGTASVTISSASVSGGPGFRVTSPSFPLTIPAGQTAKLYLEFDPTTAGSVSGGVTLATNTSAGKATISLSGTGQATSYEVNLTWDAPTSSADPVASYNIYRAVSGSSSYQLLNSSTTTNYADSTVSTGTTYVYYVESVDDQGNQSGPSNTFSISIP